MIKNFIFILLIFILGTISFVAANPNLGKPAPNFLLVDLSDRVVRLEDFKGKNVVLIFYVDYN